MKKTSLFSQSGLKREPVRSKSLRGSMVARAEKAFSLVEVLIAMGVLALVGMAVVANVVISTKIAHANVLKTTAMATAQSFLEQIKSMNDSDINEAMASPSSVPLNTVSISALATNDLQINDPLYLSDPYAVNGKQNKKKILIDLRDDDNSNKPQQITMTMWMDVNITQVTGGYGYLIEIYYSFEADGLTKAFIPSKTQRLFTVKSYDKAS